MLICLNPEASIRAAQAYNRAILALESNEEIFKQVLQPLQASSSKAAGREVTQTQELSDDDDDLSPDQGTVSLCE